MVVVVCRPQERLVHVHVVVSMRDSAVGERERGGGGERVSRLGLARGGGEQYSVVQRLSSMAIFGLSLEVLQ